MATQAETYRARIEELTGTIRRYTNEYPESSGNVPDDDGLREWESAVSERAELRERLASFGRLRAASSPEEADRLAPGLISGDPNAIERLARRSAGARFTQDDAYTRAIEATGGRLGGAGTRFSTEPVQMGGLLDFRRQAALLTGGSDTSAGAFVVNDRTALVNALGRRPLRIRDIVRVLRTSSDLVEFVRQTARTNNAAPVAEATAASGSSGVKPESDMAFEIVQTPVKVIANWMPVTRQAVADAPQLRDMIDTELEDNVEEELEDQVLTGDGTGQNFTGILNTTGTQSQAYTTGLLVTTRKARTIAMTVGRVTPNAWVFHPNDWEDFDLLTDNETRYYFGGPLVMGTPRLWGLPVVESEAETEGVALLGDFQKAVIWDREDFTIRISDSHSDFFIRNLLAVLGELRAAFGVLQPSAFVETDLTP